MSTSVTDLTIKAVDRKDFLIRAELWRTVNAVGRWLVTLDNTGQRYGATGFDIQDDFRLDTTSTIMRGRIDGPGVTFKAVDAVDDWGEFLLLQGVDQMQDLLFHNDLEYSYPENAAGQQIKDVLQDIFITPRITTNITYPFPVGATPAIGGIEFREGGSFIGTLQELHRRANYLFYVDDTLVLQSGAPGFSASAVNVVEGTNILKFLDWNRKRGDKLYNYIKIYGKNPQFDAWTEFNAASWVGWPFAVTNDLANARVGTYSLRMTNALPLTGLQFWLNAPIFNYPANGFDLTKGKIGVWAYYDNVGGGVAPAQMRVNCRLRDNAGGIADYFGSSSYIYRDHWGFCEFPLGEDYNASGILGVADRWNVIVAGTVFNWDQVDRIEFHLPRPSLGGNQPFNFYIDGLTLPIPPIAVAQNVASQGGYRYRPFILNRSDIRTQNALDSYATSLLAHHKDSSVDYIKLMVIGNPLLRYAGQSVTITAPTLGINAPGTLYYMTDIHHVIQPRTDVSGGYGYDYITEIEGIPVSSLALDHVRLGNQSVLSAYRAASAGGTGLREK